MERPPLTDLSDVAREYIAYQDKQIAMLLQRIENLSNKDEQIEQMQQRIENLTNMLLNLQKRQFGAKSEKHAVPAETGEQLSLFNEAEAAADPQALDQAATETEVKAHKRRRQAGHQERMLEHLPVQEVEFELPDNECVCPRCAGALTRIGREYLRTEVEYIPAHTEARKYYRRTYACKNCSEGTSACDLCDHADVKVCSTCPERPRTVFVQAEIPPEHRRPVIRHSIASASSAAQVIYSKYALSLPLYRQVQEWKRSGVELSRQTLSNWVLIVSRDWMSPLYGYLRKVLLGSDILHCDETTVQVLREEGKKATSSSYMWVFRTGELENRAIVLFDYQATRSGEVAKRFLEGFTGYYIADGYSGYNKVTGATRCGCWAHVRRYFLEAIPGTKQSTGSKAEKGVRFCDQLFRIEQELRDLSPDKRKRRRQELSQPLLEDFWEWLQELRPMKNAPLNKAITYAVGQKDALSVFLQDGRIPISNNPVENAIRPFAVGRKNWIFCNVPRGATASATAYSIIETAKLNGLDAYKYLRFLLRRLPTETAPFTDDVLEKLAPWSQAAQAECK